MNRKTNAYILTVNVEPGLTAAEKMDRTDALARAITATGAQVNSRSHGPAHLLVGFRCASDDTVARHAATAALATCEPDADESDVQLYTGFGVHKRYVIGTPAHV